MRTRRPLSLGLILALLAPLRAPAETLRYMVGAGDVLYVDFPLRGTPSDLQPLGGNGLTLVIVGDGVFFRYEATVAPDGFISLPSMKPVRVAGLTLEEVRDAIASDLKSFSLRHMVSVLLAHPNSQAVVVTGEVQKPGRFVYERPTSLLEALALAGGATPQAQLKRIQLFRRGQPPEVFDFSYKRLRQHGAPEVALQPSDAVVVPRRAFTPDAVWIFMLLSIVTTAATVYVATK